MEAAISLVFLGLYHNVQDLDIVLQDCSLEP